VPPVEQELSLFLLAMLLPLIAVVTLYARPHALLVAGLLCVVLPQSDWIIANTRIDPRDLILVALVVAVLLRPRPMSFRSVPYIGLWVVLGILTSIAYVHAPINQPNLTDPARIAYQIYRYCWKPILFYPLAYLLIGNDPKARADTVTGILISGVIVSIHASIQGYGLEDPKAFFSGGNSMGGALLVPFVFALAGSLEGRSTRRVLLHLAALLIITRGIIFANSRGAFVATVAGVGAFMCLMLTWQIGRKAVARVIVSGVVFTVLLFIAVPNLLERPNIQHILTAIKGTSDSNFQWRATERWPVFMEKIEQHPWFGMGTNRDLSLSEAANTPHNGYLSLAVTYGIPAASVMVLFVVFGVVNSFRASRRTRQPRDRIFLLATTGGLTGMLVHNIVESTFMIPFVYDLAWVLTGITTAILLKRSPAAVPEVSRAGSRQHVRRPRPRRLQRRPIPITAPGESVP
jgi:O-antigen ligase